MGASVIECDVTFTKDAELVCRHAQCDLHTTTNIVAPPMPALLKTNGSDEIVPFGYAVNAAAAGVQIIPAVAGLPTAIRSTGSRSDSMTRPVSGQ
jgi:glycerophosphoryl diester phosphodiesterase